MEAGERQGEDGPGQSIFVDTSMLEAEINILESEIMTPSPMAVPTPLHEALNTTFQTPIGKPIAEEDNSTINSIRTPADNLLDKFQSLNDSWVDVKTRSASAKKRVVTTPSIEDFLNSPIPKFASALGDISSNDGHRDHENDDLSSIGASTVSSISSSESVFDRLHRHGTNQQRRRRTQKPSDSFASPRENIYTNEFYTPYSSTSSVSSSKSRKSRNSTSKQQTNKKIRNRVVPTSAASSSVGKSKTRSESKVSPASSQDSVFDRLYRNQKRSETLWQAPPAPHLASKSADRKKSGRKSGSSRRASKIPAPSTPQTASKPKQKKKRISDSPATASNDIVGTSSSIEPLLEAASTATDSVDLTVSARSTVEESTRDDSEEVRASASLTFGGDSMTSEKENKSRPGMVAAPREQPTALKNANWSTTSIDEDLAELAAIQRDLDQQQQHLAPTPRKTNVPMERMFEHASSIEPKELYAPSDDQAAAAAASHSILDDFDDILKAPQVPRSRAPSVASTATHTQAEDDDTTSRASSGFFTLDNARRSLTLQPLVSFPKGSIGSKLSSSPKTVKSKRTRPEQAAVTIQSWWKSCMAQVSLANMVIEHRNLTFPSAHDTSPMVLLRIINSTRPNSLTIRQQNDVLLAQSSQIALELRLASPTFSVLRKRLSNTMLLRAVLTSARLEFEGVVFVEACQRIQRWWRRTRETIVKPASKPLTAPTNRGSAKDKELSFYLEDANVGLVEENLLETLYKGSPERVTYNRASVEPQKTPVCTELSLLDDIGDSDEEPLVSPAKPSISQNNEVEGGRILFQSPLSSVDLASDNGYGDQSSSSYDIPAPVETPPRRLSEGDSVPPAQVETPDRTSIGEDVRPMPVSTPRSLTDEGHQGGDSDQRHEAASVIQRSFRMLTLTSAVEQSTPTRDRVRQQLSSPKFPRWQEDDPWLFKEPSDGFQLWVGSTDLIERNAARLATLNIIRAYLNGLRKYRRAKKAGLIQATFRGYQCRREYQKKQWAAVAIQHGWKRFKYRRMLKSKATVIEAAYKMKMAKNKFQMMKFAAVLIQSKWRSHHATREYSKAKFLASWLQRTCVRARGQRRRFLALRSAAISLQYALRVHRAREQFKLEVAKATKIQSTWRMSFAKRNRLLSIYYACKIQAQARSHFASKDYAVMRSSCIAIQSCWRKYSATKRYKTQLVGAVKLQATWRRFVDWRSYKNQYQSVVRLQSLGRMQQCLRLKRKNLQAAVTIQRETRRFLVERSYIITWKATLMIQSQQRRHSAQRSWRKTLNAAVCIQSVVRAHMRTKSYRQQRDASVKIQSLGRSYNQRCHFMEDRKDITIAQSVVRRKLAQNYLEESRAAAIRCQKTIRCHISSSTFRRAKTASTEIQKVYRRFNAIQNREIAMNSVIRIQSFLRMAHARKSWNHAVFSVRIVQRVVRGYQQWSKFTMQREAAVKIQSIARSTMDQVAYLEQRNASIALQAVARQIAARNRLLTAKNATVTIQKAIRKTLCRSKYLQTQLYIRKIQATARGFSERLLYNSTRNDVLTIQRCWRGAIARVQASSHYRAALVLQCYWRGKTCRELYDSKRHAAISIQACCRKYLAAKHFERAFMSIRLIQSHWRMTCCQAEYTRTRVLAVMIQALTRGRLLRRNLAHLSSLSTRIQRHWRGHLGRLVYNELIEKRNSQIAAARLTIQATWRMHIKMEEFRKIKSAAIVVQREWRAFSAWESYEFSRIACIVIQTISRGVLVRMKMKMSHQSALSIQKSWRGYLGAKRFQNLFEQDRLAKLEKAERLRRTEFMALAICAYHGIACISIVVLKDFARQQNELERRSSTKIQSQASKPRNLLPLDGSPPSQALGEVLAATKIQAICRTFWARKYHDARLQSVIMIQSYWRRHMARRQAQLCIASSVFVQRSIRGFLTRVAINRWRKSAIFIQKSWRGYIGAKKFKSLSEFERSRQSLAALKIQAIHRMKVARGIRRSALKSAVTIQKHWRSSEARVHYEVCCVSCVIIQSITRGILVREDFKIRSEAVAVIQKYWRRVLARERYELCRASCVIMQSIIRKALIRNKISLLSESAASVQKTGHEHNSPKKVQSSVEDASRKWSPPQTPKVGNSRLHVSITSPTSESPGGDSTLPSIAAIDVVQDLLNRSATPIQKVWRGASLRGSLANSRTDSAILIQASFRGHRARQLYQTTLTIHSVSATLIQKVWRGASLRVSLANSQVHLGCAATQIQTSFRGYRARQLYQTTLMVRSMSAIVIQAHVRGMFTRSIVARACAASRIQRFWKNRSIRLALLQLSMDERLTKELEESFKTQGAIVLQSLARGRIAQKTFRALRTKIVLIQSLVRGHILRMQLHKMRLDNEIGAAITIQKHVRGAHSRSYIRGLHDFATIIQAVFRMFLVAREFWFLRLPRETREMLHNAARKIQVAFFLFKMRLAVLSMQSSAIILKRCIRGQLVRSAAKFALVHVNSAFHNPVILSFARVVAGNDPNYAPTYVAWKRAVTQAEITSVIVIQSAARRFLVRTRIFREFNVSFDSHMLLDQTLIEDEHTSAVIIQQAFRRWSCRKNSSLVLEKRLQERNQAAIQLQRLVRGRKDRILVSTQRKREAQMSRDATALVYDAIQRFSEARVHRLLESHSTMASLSPTLQLFVDRTRAVQSEAAMLASNPLPKYAVEVLKKPELPIKDSSSKTKRKVQIKPIARLNVNASPQAPAVEAKRPSTPVRCNKTQTVKKAMQSSGKKSVQLNPPRKASGMGAMDLLKFGRESMKKKASVAKASMKPTTQLKTNVQSVKSAQAPNAAPRQAKPSTQLETSVLSVKPSIKSVPVAKPAPTQPKKPSDVISTAQAPKPAPQPPKKDGKVAMSALDLIKFGRETIKKAPTAKSSSKPTAQRPQTSVTNSTPAQQSPPRQGFGDPNNMPSPIKKQADWDWADEW